MRRLKTALLTLTALVVTASVRAEEARPSAVILDHFGSWRMFHVLKQPEIAFDDGVKAVVYGHKEHYWLNGETPRPAEGWTSPEFDDAGWLRGPVGMGCRASFVARACLRGKFRVVDPAQAEPLTLALRFHGGAAVYLNGQEVGRKHLAAGADLAEAYSAEAFLTPEGALLVPEGRQVNVDGKIVKAGKPDDEALRRTVLRERTLTVELPVRLLRKGVNVLAVEIVRAPYHKAVDEQKTICWNKEPLYNLQWNTCELLEARLTSGGAVQPETARPPGLQVWNGSLLRTDFALDSGDPCESARPIALMGARNGVFSGKLIIGSAGPIRGLEAVPSALSGPGGTIPASALEVRYGVPGGEEFGIYEYTYGLGSPAAGSPARAGALSILSDVPPAEYAPAQDEGAAMLPGSTSARGAVAPIWLKVRVPFDAGPGRYEGKLVVRCEGEQEAAVPVELTVADWALPDPDDYQSWTEVLQSPDTLQLEYGVPAWSDGHFELIAQSFRLMREVGSGVVYLPLICCTHYGNEESVVRWVRRGDQGYDFDFTVLDRYMDVAQENLGKPKIVCFIVWEVFLLPARELSVGGGHSDIPKAISRHEGRMTAPFVTTADPATGQVDRVSFPDYFTDPECKAHWQDLFRELRARMKRRGLEEAMMLGWFTDVRAQREELDFWREVTGDLPWVSHAHHSIATISRGRDLGIKAGYSTSIHDTHYPADPAVERRYGWRQKPVIHAQQLLRPGWRGEMDRLPGTMWNSMTEITIAGGQRGFGRLGGDSWRVIRDKKGRRTARAYERYPWSIWSNLELCCSLLAPGPNGPVATAHFEQLREGVQACEARIFIEQALTDEAKRKALSGDLAQRCQAALDERILCELRGVANFVAAPHDYSAPWKWIFQTGEAGHAWYQSSGWQERNAMLYALAGEVARTLDGR